jgi:hypothetical protein
LPPFAWSKETSQPPIQPIQDLLEQLLSEHDKDSEPDRHAGFDFALLEIPRRLKQNASSHITLNDFERITLLNDGILFRDKSIVVGHSKPQPLKTYPAYFHRGLGLFRPRGNETTSIIEVLAHRPPGVYQLLRRGDI